MALTKIAYTVPVTQEMIDQTPTFEQIMEGARRRDMRRADELFDELLYGAHLNPCIVLGDN